MSIEVNVKPVVASCLTVTTEPSLEGTASDVNEYPRVITGHSAEEACGKYYCTPREEVPHCSEEHVKPRCDSVCGELASGMP